MESIEGMARVEEWLQWLGERGRSERTITVYRSAMRHCLRSLEAAGLSTEPEGIGERAVRLIAGEDGRETSRRLRVHVLTSFTEWATGEGLSRDAGIMWNHEECDRLFLDDRDMATLLRHADERETLILTMGACMGLRRSEIAAVRISDIEGGRLTVHGKGHGRGKRAVLRIPPAVERAIIDYMRVRPETDLDSLLVVNERGRPRAMSDDRIYEIVKALGERTEVEVTPHALRRLFATTLREMDVALDDIRTLMRHEKIETTLDCYIKPNTVRLDSIMDQFV